MGAAITNPHLLGILIENPNAFFVIEDALQIQVTLCPTIDFIMKLLSFGSDIKVLQPQSLILAIKNIYTEALKQYKH